MRVLWFSGISVVRKPASGSGSVAVQIHHFQRDKGFYGPLVLPSTWQLGRPRTRERRWLGPAPSKWVTELEPEPVSGLPAQCSLHWSFWIIHGAPGDAFLSESSHYCVFSAWQAAKSLELLHVTILPSAEWDITIVTWGLGHGVPSINICELLWAIWARGIPEMGDPGGGIWALFEVLPLLCRIREMAYVINYSLWAVFVLKAQPEFPERFLSTTAAMRQSSWGSEMELWLNAWNLFLVLFLITALFLFLWRSLEEGWVERRGKGRKEAGKYVIDSRKFLFVCLFLSCLLSAKIKGFNGSCRDANLIPMEPELRGRVTNTMKTQLEVRATVIWLINLLRL